MCGSTIGNGRYDKTKEFKINLCKDNNIPLITLYPDDFKLVNEKFETSRKNILACGNAIHCDELSKKCVEEGMKVGKIVKEYLILYRWGEI